MTEIKTILCPIDFSDYSRRALDYAATIARWYESTITLFHVYPTAPIAAFGLESPAPGGAVLTPADRERMTAAIASFVEPSSAAEIPTEVVIGQSVGSTANEILKQARSMPADLLVIGTHGRSGFDRLVLGSVTEKVLRKADCPVLTVPHAPTAAPIAPAVFKRILCPVDFSDSSMHALNYAMSLAQEADARLTVLHVMQYDLEVEAPEMYETVIADRRLSLTDYRTRCEEYSRERLRAAVPETVGAYCTVEVLLAIGRPYREILRVAAEQQADLIAMGVQGRSAADVMVFGSTTQHVVRQATCPVLTVRKG